MRWPRSLGREWRYWLLPSFDETTLFLMSVTIILLTLTSAGFRHAFMSMPLRLFPVLVGAAIGMALSLYHAFSLGEKDAFSKTTMAVFVAVANGTAGLLVGMDQLRGPLENRWPAIINIAAAILLIYQVGVFESECINDRDATPADLLVGSAALAVVFVIVAVIQKQPWPVTFSLCVSYSTLVHDKAVTVTRELRARVGSERST